MLNFAVCDDNLNILNRMCTILDNIFIKYNYDASIVLKTTSADNLLSYIDTNKIDVLILDINLKSTKTGLEIAEIIRKKHKDFYLIFTTAHLEYLMLAFKFKTFDYIAKPFTYERLEETINRLFDDIKGLPSKYLKIDNKNTIIDENEIEFIKRDGMKVVFHTSFNDYDTYSSFNKLQDSLPNNFIRCHKSYVVNINNIKNIDFVENRIYFKKGDFCEIGPKYKKSIMGVLESYGIFE